MRTRPHVAAAFALLALSGLAHAQQKRVYICPDDHTDYFWTASDEAYRGAFIRMIDYYLDQADLTQNNPPDFRQRWHCDGSQWLWEYERNKTASDYQRLISRIRDGTISVALNPLVINNGGSPAEAVIRGMYYPGRIERREGLRFSLAMYQENSTFPLGLPALWAGSGARYSWKGVCDCDTRVPDATNRPHEVYRAQGPDGSGVLMKWQSLFAGGANQSIGGYAEAYDPAAVVDQVTTNAPFNGFAAKWPFQVIGAVGRGWDGFEYESNEFVTIAQQKSNASRRVIVGSVTDFFEDFAAQYPPATLPAVSLSFGNEWDAYACTMAEQTARIRRATELLRPAEALSVLASTIDPAFMDGRETARDLAFQDLGLFFEHDMGMVGPPAGQDGINRRIVWQHQVADAAEQYATTLLNDAASLVAAHIPAGPAPRAYVFNPLSWERSDAADLAWSDPAPVHVVDLATGQEAPSQRVTINGQPFLRFWAASLPSVGYRVYEIQPGAGQAFADAASVSGGQAVTTATFTIDADNRDALSNHALAGPDETRVSGYAPDDRSLYWSNDGDTQTAALEFACTLPRGATIREAHLELHAVPAVPSPSGASEIHLYDVDDAAAFVNGPSGDLLTWHPTFATTIAWPQTGWSAGTIQASPDITALVQHYVNRPGYQPGNHIGLCITEGSIAPNTYYGFDDFSKPGGSPARLVVTYDDPNGNPSGSSLIINNQRDRVELDASGKITSWVNAALGNREMAATVNGRAINDLGGSGGSVQVENAGPVSVTLLATSSSPVAHNTRVTLYRQGDRVDIANQITQGFDSNLEWAESFALASPTLRHEELGAIITAALASQGGDYSNTNARYDLLTLNHFADLTQAGPTPVGVTLSSWDCDFMTRGNSTPYVLDTTTPQLRVIAGGKVVSPGIGIPNQLGDTLFTQRFALRARGAQNDASSMRFALEHQNPPITRLVTGASPTLATSPTSLLSVDQPGVIAWAFKVADDGWNSPDGGIALRLWNVGDAASTAAITLAPALAGPAIVSTHIETPDPTLGPAPTPLPQGFAAAFARQQLRTFRVTPAAPPACDPDVNQDGVADQGDVDYLINVIAGGENPSGIDPDFNQDGVADQGDVDAIINVVAGGQCP
ncbi:MAG: hypothetical protein GC200_01890 [Tepidisphaera sp.]|nr:hypothetical protein [Tepidisphaera sp.]